MCFSAAASFATSAILLPLGGYAVFQAYKYEKRYLLLAAMPVLFSVQQSFEGGLWLILNGQLDIKQLGPALGFLFFAYFLWPFYVPLAAFCVEDNILRKRMFLAVAFVGFLIGSSLYFPLLINQGWLSIGIVSGSLLYEPTLIYDDILSRDILRIIYAVIVATPLLLSTVPKVRAFGILIFISVVASAVLFTYAFVSIWCFFAALLSLYIVYVMHSLSLGVVRLKTA